MPMSRSSRLVLCLVAAVFGSVLLSAVASVRADQVVLRSGASIEGKALQRGDVVVIQLESGEVSLPADEVLRIESAASSIDTFEARRAKLGPTDVKARLALAEFCRDRDMRSREEQMLREVLAIDPNQATARARLGYVKTERGWMTIADANRARGLLLRDGQWLTPEQALERERLRAQTELAQKEREQAQLELEGKRLELAAQRARAEAEAARSRAESAAPTEPVAPVLAPVYVPVYRSGAYDAERDCAHGRHCTQRKRRADPFPIPGVRDPRDPTFSIPGVKDPHEYL
jgi:hypothetical protein